MKTTSYVKVIFTGMLIVLSMSAVVQGKLALTTIKTNVVTNGDLDSALVAMRDAMDATNTPFYWLVAESQSGEGHYIFATPHESYSIMDVNWPAAIGEAMSEAELIEFVNDLRTSIKSMSTTRYNARPDLSRAAPEGMNEAVPDAVVLIHLDVVEGKQRQFEDFVKQVIAASDTTAPNTYWQMMSPAFGTNDYLVVATIPQWEDLDTPGKSVSQRIIEHFGERRGERMVEAASGYLHSATNQLYRTRPDVSRPHPGE
jgi:hypothetical protein